MCVVSQQGVPIGCAAGAGRSRAQFALAVAMLPELTVGAASVGPMDWPLISLFVTLRDDDGDDHDDHYDHDDDDDDDDDDDETGSSVGRARCKLLQPEAGLRAALRAVDKPRQGYVHVLVW